MRYLKGAPSFPAISPTDAKTYLRVSGASEDNLITELVKSATRIVENFLGWDVCDYEYSLILNGVPVTGSLETYNGSTYPIYTDKIELLRWFVKSITEYKWVAPDGTETIVSNSDYHLFVDKSHYYLALNEGVSWPSNIRSYDSLKIKFKTGYANASEIPEDILSSIKTILMHLYEHRGEDENIKLPAKAFSAISTLKLYK